MQKAVKIGYWDCRGLAHASILMLEYLKVPYVYETPPRDLLGPAPKYEKTGWLAKKEALLEGFDFPNLPYFHDPARNIKLTQSSAIIMHIARSTCLWPSNTDEQTMSAADVLREELKDFIVGITSICYDHALTEEKQQTYENGAKKKLYFLHKKLSKSQGKWFMGEQLTYPDFMAYEALDHHRLVFESILDEFPKLSSFMLEIEALPPIKEYMESARYRQYPLWSERSNHLGRGGVEYP